MKHHFGDAFRAARLAKGLAQDGFDIPQSHVSRLESGQKMPSWERVEALAEVLGIHPLTLFTLAYEPKVGEVPSGELANLVQSEIAEIVAARRD